MRWSVVGLTVGFLVVLAAGPAAAQVRSDFSRVFGDDLTQSIERGDVDAVRRALTRGYNPGKAYTNGQTPLMRAAVAEQPEIAGLLLEFGANVRARDKLGNSALFYAADAGSFETAELLLESGADLNARNRRGVSSLMSAARGGHRVVVEVLIDRGAAPTLPDCTGRTALEIATENRHRTVVRLLETKTGSR